MIYPRSLVATSLVGLLLPVFSGCSNPYDGRMEVTGNVTLEGKPLDGASISFFPLDGQDTSGGGAITNGEYNVPRPQGLKPGKYLVRITAGDGKTPHNEELAQPGGSTNIISFDRVPPEWNTDSKQEREIKANQPNRFDFEIPKANTRRR